MERYPQIIGDGRKKVKSDIDFADELLIFTSDSIKLSIDNESIMILFSIASFFHSYKSVNTVNYFSNY